MAHASERPHKLLRSLTGGDRRSIGRSNQVASLALRRPGLVGVLFEGIASTDPLLRMRCADALEKVTASRPELLRPWKRTLLNDLPQIDQAEVRWHVAPMLARLPLMASEERQVLKILAGFTRDRSSIVRTLSMQAMADIALRSPGLLPGVERRIRRLASTGTPAVKVRGRKLLSRPGRARQAHDGKVAAHRGRSSPPGRVRDRRLIGPAGGDHEGE